jgi:deoxyribodipyrimidine photolyase
MDIETTLILFNRDLRVHDQRMGGRLFIRRGDPVREAIAVARECGAGAIHVSADWSAYAQGRGERLVRACAEERIEFTAHPAAMAFRAHRGA